jgi:hypothetical protein
MPEVIDAGAAVQLGVSQIWPEQKMWRRINPGDRFCAVRGLLIKFRRSRLF